MWADYDNKSVCNEIHKVFIDVGGTIFVSTLETLQKSPKLKKIIETHDHENECVFIDRDAFAFYNVLNIMDIDNLFHQNNRILNQS